MIKGLKKLNIYLKLAIIFGALVPVVIVAIVTTLLPIYGLASDNAISTAQADSTLHSVSMRVQVLEGAGFVIGVLAVALMCIGLAKQDKQKPKEKA